MSDLFAGVYGARFPDVVMNSGPLPPSGGLPAPLHDTPDSRINYNSTLLGNLQPYAYGEPGYQSSQNSYLNIPHRIQKILPVLYLPEPHGREVFRLSHSVDDSDIAFVMRLNRGSIFCTGTRSGARRSGSLGVVADPLINLATLNYLLAGIQTAMPFIPDKNNMFWELLFNLDSRQWPQDPALRNYNIDDPEARPITLSDLVHFVRNCVRPFGVVRGSEKQGGQSEMTDSPATWPVPAIVTLVIDGKEANVINVWHGQDVHAGDDLVLRLKLMPLQTYTLNHYYKGFARKSFDLHGKYVWQLVPDVMAMELKPKEDLANLDLLKPETFPSHPHDSNDRRWAHFSILFRQSTLYNDLTRDRGVLIFDRDASRGLSRIYTPWQELGYWHIGRCQVRMQKCSEDEFYNDDMASNLKINHLEMTFQPVFAALPMVFGYPLIPCPKSVIFTIGKKEEPAKPAAPLGLERLGKRAMPERWACEPARPRARFESPVIRAPPARPARPVTLAAPAPPATPAAPAPPMTLEAPVPPTTPADPAPLTTLEAPALSEPPAAPAAAEPVIEPAADALLPGLGAPLPKKPRGGRGKKAADGREPVDGMILTPGSDPLPCRVELL